MKPHRRPHDQTITQTPTRRRISLSHISAGFIAVLVGYTSSIALIFQAATAAGANDAQLASWMWALGIGSGVSTIALSLVSRMPLMVVWSTPGAALLATSLGDIGLDHAIGAFIISSLLITICGVTGWFRHILAWVPRHLASAMLAGILLQFGLDLFASVRTAPALVLTMLATFIAARRILPRYGVALAFLAGILYVLAASGGPPLADLNWLPARPVWMDARFSVSAIIGVALPLFIVTMTSQNIPGLAVLRASGYDQVPASRLIGWTGVLGLIMAPFGGFIFNLAAITAAICMSPDADPDPSQRYKATAWAGVFYALTGLFGATVVGLFTAFPGELVAAIAGLALLATIGAGLADALRDRENWDASLVTFLATASGMSLLGIGSAFWGLILGGLCHALLSRRATTATSTKVRGPAR